MGQPPTPPYADSFMAKKIDPAIRALANKYSDKELKGPEFLKRFLDDLFNVFVGATKNLHTMFDEINKIHPNIKFTMEHTFNPDEDESDSCDCPKTESVPYLDTLCSIREGKIVLDLYIKKANRSKPIPPH